MTTPAPPGPATGPAGGTSGAARTSAADAALLRAAGAALAAEQAAVWGYPVLGPRLTDPGQVALARAADDAHRTAADSLTLTLSGLGVTPPAPAAAYPLPSAVTTPAQAVAYAADLEDATAAAWRYVVARTAEGADVGGLKATAVQALVAAAVRATRWRAAGGSATPTVAFPGT